jgi:hypothetical protein
MAVDRLLPVSTTPGAVTGDSYMDAVQEEVTGLWNTGTVLTLSAVAGTNTITATLAPAMTAGLANGMNFILRAAATNTSTVTLNINGGGAVAVVDGEGTALTAGAIRNGGHYLLTYNSTSTHFRIVGYTPAANVPVGSKLIKTLSGGGPSYDFVNGVSNVVLDDTYDTYEISISNLIPATDDRELWLLVGTGGGPTYQTTLYDYSFRYQRTGSPADIGVTSQAKIVLAGETAATGAVSSSTSEAGASVTIRFDNPESAAIPKLFCYQGAWQASVNTPGTLYTCTGAGIWQATTAITAIRIIFETGNITSGRASLYGITKA